MDRQLRRARRARPPRARRPQLLAGAAAFDAPTNLAARYRAFRFLRFGLSAQRLARIEVGGTPWQDSRAWAARSPIDRARRVGYWRHSAEFRATRRLPYALALFGLMPPYGRHAPGLERAPG